MNNIVCCSNTNFVVVVVMLRRVGKGMWVKAPVGDFVENSRSKREMCIGEVGSGVGKDSFMVSFPGLGISRNLKSKQLTILSENELLDYASANGGLGSTNGGLATASGGSGVSEPSDAVTFVESRISRRSHRMETLQRRIDRPGTPPPTSILNSSSTGNDAVAGTTVGDSVVVGGAVPTTPGRVGGTAGVVVAGAASTVVTPIRPTHPDLTRAPIPPPPSTTVTPVDSVVVNGEGGHTTGAEGGHATAVGNAEEDGNAYAARVAATKVRLRSLIGREVVSPLSTGGSIKWKVVDEHHAPSFKVRASSQLGYNWEYAPFPMCDEYVFAKIFLSLLFDDFQVSLAKMNSHLTDKGPAGIKMFCVEEFLKGLGILIGAACFHQKGHHLFNASSGAIAVGGTDYSTLEELPNFRRYMYLYRWKQFIKFFPMIWKAEEEKTVDPWWRIRRLVDEFNSLRMKWIHASNILVFDESIIGYRPQVNPTGNLPHITFMKEKPCDLGTEGKLLMCSQLGTVALFKLQEGRLAMESMKYNKKFGAQTGCVIRMQEEL